MKGGWGRRQARSSVLANPLGQRPRRVRHQSFTGRTYRRPCRPTNSYCGAPPVGASFFCMPDQFQWADADADKSGEMVASESAYTRLFEALRQLQADLDDVPATSLRLKPYLSKRQSALHALQRHAQATIAEFGFVDGAKTEKADPQLLAAFYPDPMHSVASRYCWALLTGDNDQPSLQQIIAATRVEFEAFLLNQAGTSPNSRSSTDLNALIAAESAHSRRTDRLAYRLAALRRLMIVHRHVIGPSGSTSVLETEIAQSIEASEEATESLREIRRTKISKR